MDSDNDFTFCQVALPIDQDVTQARKLVQDVGGIQIKDEFTDDRAGNQSNGVVPKDELPSSGALKKEATFGSLSFSVADASPSKQSSEMLGQASSENAGKRVTGLPEPRAAARKTVPRTKVPFEKGYSQMDWLKLTQTHADLAGLQGQSNRRLISMSEVKQHRTEGSMWTVLKGRVYNLSPYMKFHPGGVDILMKAVGKDCTSLFNKYHAWVNAEFLLEKCLVGTLDDSK